MDKRASHQTNLAAALGNNDQRRYHHPFSLSGEQSKNQSSWCKYAILCRLSG
jgi:hypothetical protein